MAIVPFAALGTGQLLSAKQRHERESDPDAAQVSPSEKALAVSKTLEKIANEKGTSFQAIVSGDSSCLKPVLTSSGPRISTPSINLCLPHCGRQHCGSHKRHA